MTATPNTNQFQAEDEANMAKVEAAWEAAYKATGEVFSPSVTDLITIACKIDSAVFAPADEDDLYEMLCEGFTLAQIVESFYETK